jgi:hypothetical protein
MTREELIAEYCARHNVIPLLPKPNGIAPAEQKEYQSPANSGGETTDKPTSFMALTALAEPEPTGRFARQNLIVGGGPDGYTPASAHHGQDRAVEPPLGYSVEDQTPTGSAHEVAASLPEESGK